MGQVNPILSTTWGKLLSLKFLEIDLLVFSALDIALYPKMMLEHLANSSYPNL